MNEKALRRLLVWATTWRLIAAYHAEVMTAEQVADDLDIGDADFARLLEMADREMGMAKWRAVRLAERAEEIGRGS